MKKNILFNLFIGFILIFVSDNMVAQDITQKEKNVPADMKLTVDGEIYHVILDKNSMTEDILQMLPLKMTFERHGNHEYHASLPQKLSLDNLEKTCDARAGSLYYFDGWSSLSLFFEDVHTDSPHVVHIGDIVEDIVTPLKSAGKELEIKIEK